MRYKSPYKLVYAKSGDAGLDLRCLEDTEIQPGETVKIPTGVAVELPSGFQAEVRGRSSLNALGILTHLGTIDSGYRGEILVVITNLTSDTANFEAGQRIAQLVVMPYHRALLTQVEELTESERGTGGFGSTGEK